MISDVNVISQHFHLELDSVGARLLNGPYTVTCYTILYSEYSAMYVICLLKL